MIYLYCVTDKVPKVKDVENLVDEPYSIYQDGLYAVVNRVSKDEFSEENLRKNLGDMEWIKEKARGHEGVIEGIMRDTCVIPFKFATLFNTEESLKAMLEEHGEKLKMNLKDLEGKEEWGVKIYCALERLKETVVKEDTGVLEIEDEIDSSPPGKAYLLKKKREELIKDEVNKRVNRYGQEGFEILKGLSIKARINRLLPKEVTEREDDMILNSAFLVDKGKVKEFLQAVDGLQARYIDKGTTFDCTGPWPPYNFCYITSSHSPSLYPFPDASGEGRVGVGRGD